MKKSTIDERKKKNKKILNNLNNKSDYKSNNNTYVNKTQINECKKLLKYMGIPVIESIEEADQQCAGIASYYKKEIVGIISDDSDMLVFGGPKLLKDFNIKNDTTSEIDRKHVLKYLLELSNKIRIKYNLKKIKTISHENFVNFSILMGTDYKYNNFGCKIKGISHDKLFEIFCINDFDMINTIKYLENEYYITVSDKFMESWKSIKNLYDNSPVIHPSEISIAPNEINYDKLINLLCYKNNINFRSTLKQIKEFNDNIQEFKYLNCNKKIM
jgi:5'-3' exonuclease